jgi:hypothetical protein
MLANLAALDLDTAILDVCTERIPRAEFGYSRYVDDITISGDNTIVELLPAIYPLSKILASSATPAKPGSLEAQHGNG